MLKYVMTRVPGSCAVFMAVFLVISPAIAADLPEAIPNDPNRDALYARLEAAAEAGDPLAQYQFAELNENWKAGYHNYSKTLHWYKQSAENGNVLAQFRLGYMYRRRVSVDTDFSGAVKWYTMAAAQVHVGAMEALGLMYDHAPEDFYEPQDYESSYHWYGLAAEFGSKTAVRNLKRITKWMKPKQVEVATDRT